MTDHREEYALPSILLVCGLDAGNGVMIQDDLYSRFAEHVKTIYLAI